ncbi:MAG TPA: hypothetical protein VIU39_12145 [Anaerolineales bacterium]
MKHLPRILPLLSLVFLAACGTFQVDYVPAPTSTPYVQPTPTSIAFAIPPEQCSTMGFDTTLPENPDEPASYIGHHYDEVHMPDGLVFMNGSMIDDVYLRETVSRPEFDMEFLTRTECRRQDGSPYNTVVDAIRIPREEHGYARAGYCLPDRSGPGPFIVFGHYDESKPQVALGTAQGWAMFNLDFGRHIDMQTKRFADYPLEGLECLRLSGMG